MNRLLLMGQSGEHVTMLNNVNHMVVEPFMNDFAIVTYDSNDKRTIQGFYKTKENAMKSLNAMLNWYELMMNDRSMYFTIQVPKDGDK